ncbi:hypothetical protein R3P38DRAFT_3363229 [Favolaschia claudopus]|uniref:Uncharacterized protein n=1 Tax=Favolaschia claudopus TaxID=2862362 RepID=A0AAW0AIZ0_9AGAR
MSTRRISACRVATDKAVRGRNLAKNSAKSEQLCTSASTIYTGNGHASINLKSRSFEVCDLQNSIRGHWKTMKAKQLHVVLIPWAGEDPAFLFSAVRLRQDFVKSKQPSQSACRDGRVIVDMPPRYSCYILRTTTDVSSALSLYTVVCHKSMLSIHFAIRRAKTKQSSNIVIRRPSSTGIAATLLFFPCHNPRKPLSLIIAYGSFVSARSSYAPPSRRPPPHPLFLGRPAHLPRPRATLMGMGFKYCVRSPSFLFVEWSSDVPRRMYTVDGVAASTLGGVWRPAGGKWWRGWVTGSEILRRVIARTVLFGCGMPGKKTPEEDALCESAAHHPCLIDEDFGARMRCRRWQGRERWWTGWMDGIGGAIRYRRYRYWMTWREFGGRAHQGVRGETNLPLRQRKDVLWSVGPSRAADVVLIRSPSPPWLVTTKCQRGAYAPVAIHPSSPCTCCWRLRGVDGAATMGTALTRAKTVSVAWKDGEMVMVEWGARASRRAGRMVLGIYAPAVRWRWQGECCASARKLLQSLRRDGLEPEERTAWIWQGWGEECRQGRDGVVGFPSSCVLEDISRGFLRGEEIHLEMMLAIPSTIPRRARPKREEKREQWRRRSWSRAGVEWNEECSPARHRIVEGVAGIHAADRVADTRCGGAEMRWWSCEDLQQRTRKVPP